MGTGACPSLSAGCTTAEVDICPPEHGHGEDEAGEGAGEAWSQAAMSGIQHRNEAHEKT